MLCSAPIRSNLGESDNSCLRELWSNVLEMLLESFLTIRCSFETDLEIIA